jgi:drug/metabolite transporter (DMT)-like permease
MKPSVLGAIYGIAAAAIWGGMYVVSDAVLQVIPPFALLTLRLVIGAATLAALMLITKAPRPATRGQVLTLLGVGLVGFGLSVGAQFVGTAYSTAINGAVITSASPAFILLFAWLLLKEKLTRRRLAAVALASVGVLIVLDLPSFSLAGEKAGILYGNMALVFAALTWGAYSVLVRRVSSVFSTLTVTTYALMGGLMFVAPLGLVEYVRLPAPIRLDGGLILGILYLGVVSTTMAMWLWNRAFALVPASTASLFFFAQPLVGTLLATLLLRQQISLELLIGGGLIGLGVLLAITEG